MTDQDHILFSEQSAKTGKLGVITLNRPEALNALTEIMCILMDKKLLEWQARDDVKAVLVRGEGERAFCAGGDVRKVWEIGRENPTQAASFFENEYRLNNRIFHYPKPYIALLHSITMGGGLGVSVHGSHKIAATNLKLAMPETGIGFFPDIGGSYFLPRLPHYFGFFLGLTGEMIDAHAAKSAGLIDVIVKQQDFEKIIHNLCDTELTQAAIDETLEKFNLQPQKNLLTENQMCIEKHFCHQSIEDIFKSLENDNTEFAQQCLTTLKKKSPTSLVVTFCALQYGVNIAFDDCQKVELNLAKQFLHIPDFFEGIRAALVDKDRQPKWQPTSIKEVAMGGLEPPTPAL